MTNLYLLVPIAPLVGAIVAGFFGKTIGRAGAHTITIAGVAVSLVASLMVLADVLSGNTFNGTVYTWAQIAGLKLEVGFLIDHHDGGRDIGLAHGAHLHHWLHA